MICRVPAFSGARTRPLTVNTWSGVVNLPGPITIAPGDTQRFDPNVDTTVTIDCAGSTNKGLEVQGVLEMRPASGIPNVLTSGRGVAQHRLIFANIDESRFVGGGLVPLDTDPGLWVTGAGQLDLLGTPKRGWNRTGTDPTWRAGDELRVAPTDLGDFTTFDPFDLGAPVPQVGQVPTEVCNLTRNVRIEGTPAGRAHVFIRSSARQSLRYAALRYMGPRKGGSVVLGRYPFHFHMCDDLGPPPGSEVTGCVSRDSGAHAFVPHMSSGVTFSDCVSFQTQEDAYWWDHDTVTDGTAYLGCAAFGVKAGDEIYRLTGFNLGPGDRNACRGCVAVGVLGDVNASGFLWPEKDDGRIVDGVWDHEDCVGHNNLIDGIFTWQNDDLLHEIDRFTSYRNGKAGIEHGAYVNPYIYRDWSSSQDGTNGDGSRDQYGGAALVLHATSQDDYPRRISFVDYAIDGGGITHFGMLGTPNLDIWPDAHSIASLASGGTVTGCGTDYALSSEADRNHDLSEFLEIA